MLDTNEATVALFRACASMLPRIEQKRLRVDQHIELDCLVDAIRTEWRKQHDAYHNRID